jgi:hypothetical protein
MSRSIGATVAMLLGLAAAACTDPDLERMEKVRGAVCVCKDAACVEAALKELPAVGPRQQRQAQRLASEIMFCIAKVGELEPPPVAPLGDAGPQ